MIDFILNNENVSTDLREGMTVLDFVRYHKHLKGTKIGCREGDCGACTILIGRVINNKLSYDSATSCLTPLINVQGHHVVTIEGLAMENLNVAQNKLIEFNGSQCGFCTPGFVVSMMGDFLNTRDTNNCSIDGNICRCTGYKSIDLAYKSLKTVKKDSLPDNYSINDLVSNELIPTYFKNIKERLLKIETNTRPYTEGKIIGGGTDLLVQTPHTILHQKLKPQLFLGDEDRIKIEDGIIFIKGSTTASDLMNNKILNEIIPSFNKILKLISSTPIRNIGTIAGNIINASPIGDLTAIFMALDAHLTLKRKDKIRNVPLSSFYNGYKTFDLKEKEYVEAISFNVKNAYSFNFEKVSKRKHLDIASVNTAMSINVTKDYFIDQIHISCGGVGPTPKKLVSIEKHLSGKQLTVNNIIKAQELIPKYISPISDIRGSKAYKTKLLQQLFLAHFMVLFPDLKFELKLN